MTAFQLGITSAAFLLLAALSPVNGADRPVMPNRSGAAAEPRPLREANGVLVERVSLSAGGFMVDMRYRITDPAKAQQVLSRSTRLMMIEQKTGAVLPVPEMTKVGKLRQLPQGHEPSRVYWMFFHNTGSVVKPGSKITLVLGDVKIKDVVVE